MIKNLHGVYKKYHVLMSGIQVNYCHLYYRSCCVEKLQCSFADKNNMANNVVIIIIRVSWVQFFGVRVS